MAFMWRPCDWMYFYTHFLPVDGIVGFKKPPIHYFVCADDSDDFNFNSPADDNTIVEYFDSDKDIDFVKFAGVVKNKPHCAQDYFIINLGRTYHAIKTDDVSTRFTFDKDVKYQVIELLVKKSASVEELNEKNDDLLKGSKANTDSSPFQLRDSDGNVVADGTKFSLQIIDKWEEDEDIDDEDLANLTEEELLYHNREWLAFNEFCPDDRHTIACLYEHGSEFTCETIDDIVYLKYKDMYFYNDIDNNQYDLFVGEDVPTKKQRVRIEYTEEGDFILRSWESHVLACNQFLKSSCGVVEFQVRETPYYDHSPMKLRIVRR
ncbi:hypothetical protein IWW36_000691 [Coemansia brasiliensis]|uniref:Uncharacterized protein n=1 Tax=Coemansia brasiliensis TaxID=2650707 RepID=A0A9W8LZQ3_9FUNG|nr:hypothetical protein IWW36_000691 [Coemansia brasiliensis]